MRWSAGLLALLFVLPLAPGATGLGSSSPHSAPVNWPESQNQGSGPSGANTTVAASGTPTSIVALAQLGDIDGDHYDDIAQIVTAYSGGGDNPVHADAVATARSGADLSKTLWTFVAARDQLIASAEDLDGDGVHDLFVFTFGGTGTSTSANALVAGAYEFSYDYSEKAAVLSGKTGKTSGEIPLPANYKYTEAYAFAVVVFAFASTGSYGYSFVDASMPGSLGVSSISQAMNEAYAFPAPFIYTRQPTATVSGYLPSGQSLFTKTFNDPGHSSGYPAYGDFDGDGLIDAAIADFLNPAGPVTSTQGVQIVKPTYTAVGKAGTLWSVDRNPILNAYGPYPVGDLDGDHGADLEVIEIGANDYTSLLLSGKSGATLGTSTSPDRLVGLATAFGDVNGDGKDEGLYVDFAATGATTAKVGIAGPDLKPLWTTEFNLNDGFTGPGIARDGGSVNFTADAAPDLLLSRDVKGSNRYSYSYDGTKQTRSFSIEPFSFGLEMLSGHDGKMAWKLPVKDAMYASVCGDLDGRGGQDLCIPTLVGDAAALKAGNLKTATLSMRVIAGEDGTTLLNQVLRSPTTKPLNLTGLLSVSAMAAGDVTGDGVGDLMVRVLEAGTDVPDVDVPLVSWYILSLGSKATAVASVDNTPRGDTPIDVAIQQAPPLPQAAEKATATPVTTDGAKPNVQAKTTPALGIGALGALAVGLVARRGLRQRE